MRDLRSLRITQVFKVFFNDFYMNLGNTEPQSNISPHAYTHAQKNSKNQIDNNVSILECQLFGKKHMFENLRYLFQLETCHEDIKRDTKHKKKRKC